MAFDRFKKGNQSGATRQEDEIKKTEPFIVSVNPYISVRRALDLMARISSAQVSSRLNENSNEIDEILRHHDFYTFVRENRGHLFNPDLHSQLGNELFSLLVALDNESFGNKPRVKAVVAGGFNAGKSSFLNYLVGKSILPEDMVPATAVPTFLFCQNDIDSVYVFGENKSGAIIDLDEDILQHISHSAGNSTAHQIATSLNRFIVEMPHQDYQSMVFIDTPGFGNRDNNTPISTDDVAAEAQMRSADFMIYLVPSIGGGVKEEDWNRIDSFGKRPVLLILTKNDLQTSEAAQDVFNATVSSAKRHENVFCVVSMSVYENDSFISSYGTSIIEILNRTANSISSGTEIGRSWNRVTELLNDEIEASENAVKQLETKFKETKERQNSVNKENIEQGSIIKKELAMLNETLIDDINKSDLKVSALQKILIEMYKRMMGIHKDFTSYYNNRLTSASSLLSIINDMCDALNYRADEINKVMDMSYGFYNEESRKAFMEFIEFLASSYLKELEDRYNTLDAECKSFQDRMNEEKSFIKLFSSIHKDLKTWLNKKLSELKHIPFNHSSVDDVPNIFTAIVEMDEEKLIQALSKQCDLTTNYNQQGYSPITYAAACGNIPALRLMLSLKSKGESLTDSVRDCEGRTMVEAAIQRGQVGAIEYLSHYFASK